MAEDTLYNWINRLAMRRHERLLPPLKTLAVDRVIFSELVRELEEMTFRELLPEIGPDGEPTGRVRPPPSGPLAHVKIMTAVGEIIIFPVP